MSTSIRAESVLLTGAAARREQRLIGLVLLGSALGAAACAVLLASGDYARSDLVGLAVMSFLTASGIEVGFHRLFTHRSFKARPPVRGLLAVFGSMAGQGPVAYWVSHHRLHHLHSDEAGDPHSPILRDGSPLGRVAGLLHAHVMWMFARRRASVGLFARDIVADPVLVFIDRRYHLWLLIGIIAPGLLSLAYTGSLGRALTGCLFGGLGRLFLVNHVVYSVNSVCHMFGSQPFDTRDESRNNLLLAVPTLGQSWHNNHHAFPRSARMGLAWWQIDVGYWIIVGLRSVGLVSDVLVPDTTRDRVAVRADAQPDMRLE